MMRNVGAQLSDDQLATLVPYLAENFPEKAKPQGALIAGPAQVTIKEWTLPTRGSRPHDPLATLDGTIWYTRQMANALGRIDPTTGRITEYHLDTPTSAGRCMACGMTRGWEICCARSRRMLIKM